MKFLYIGQYSEGTTSKMRADTLASILKDWQFDIIDIHIPFFEASRLMRSLGFRYKVGFAVKNINQYIKARVQGNYDVIWTDKAVFITEETTKQLKKASDKLIHFTPDPAFTYHKSKHFSKSLRLYDYTITTKSYEQKLYKKHLGNCKLLTATQGFDIKLHKSYNTFDEKINSVLFIGHYEKSREQYIRKLINNRIPVTVAGAKWNRFAKKNNFITNLGTNIYGEIYAKTISKYTLSWGAVSKWVPELHTTRTFEIPACGTALITERNAEVETFFNEDEVIFYSSEQEFVEKVKFYLKNQAKLKSISEKGHNRVIADGYDYKSILKKLLKQAEII